MTSSSSDTALWRRQPYRPLFCVGVVLAWVGVFHWLSFAMGWSLAYRREFHVLVQIQGVITSFAVGFLFTMIPRRTHTAPPSSWQIALAITAPIGVALAAWLDNIALVEMFWIALVLTLIVFALRRFKSPDAGRRPPNAFVWIPLSFLAGLIGACLIAAFHLGWYESTAIYRFGWLAVTQVMFLGLILGVGTMLLPLITRGQSSVDATGTSADRFERGMHLIGWLVLMSSCHVEVMWSPPMAAALRALVSLTGLVLVIRLYRPPTVPGLHRKLVWVAGWMIPIGYLVATLVPQQPQVGLHMVFIGGFALMTFAVGLHVTLAHGGAEELVHHTAPPVPVFGLMFILAVAFRALVNLDHAHSQVWLGLAAACFLLGTLAWAWLAVPRLVRAPE